MARILDESQRKALRSAGLLYFLMGITAPLGLLYVPGKVIVPGDPAGTAALLRSSTSLVHLGIASELFHQGVAVFLVLALYRLFKPVDKNQARLLVVVGALVSVPIMFMNVLNELAALTLVSGAGFLSSFQPDQLDSLAYLFMQLHRHGIEVTSVFWGLWLFPFGILLIRCGFAPRVVGYLMLVAGAGYLIGAFGTFVTPQYADSIGLVAFVLEMGELPAVFWLFIRGIWPPKEEAALS